MRSATSAEIARIRAGFPDVKKAARRVGLAPRTLQEYERRGVNSYERAVQLARAFGCDVTVYLNPGNDLQNDQPGRGNFFRGEQDAITRDAAAQRQGEATFAGARKSTRVARPALTKI